MTPMQARMIMDSIEAAGVKYLGVIADNQRKYALESDIESTVEHAKSSNLISRFDNPKFKVISSSYNDHLQVLPSNYDAVEIFYLSGKEINDGSGSPIEGYMTLDGFFFKSTPPRQEDDETDHSGESAPRSTYEAEGFVFPDYHERNIDGDQVDRQGRKIIPQVLPEKADKVYVEYSWEKEQQAKILEKSMSSGNAPIKDESDLPPVRVKAKLTREDKIKQAKNQHEAAVLDAVEVIKASREADIKARDLIKYVEECWEEYVEVINNAKDDY